MRTTAIHLKRCGSDHPDFVRLVGELDAELARRDGEDNVYYSQFNKIITEMRAVIAYDGEDPVGCGAFQPFEESGIEIKRMYVPPARRGKGIATQVLAELEAWVRESGFQRCVLETGKRQPEAAQLYEKQGYERIPNYGPYVGVDNSLCFEKRL